MARTTRMARIAAHKIAAKKRPRYTRLGSRHLPAMLQGLNESNGAPMDAAGKMGMLAQARDTLKREFFGIDDVIDRVITSFTGWFLFSRVQDRPFIINLWGLTGVGKTALVKRLTEVLGLAQMTFRVNLAEMGDRDFNARNEIFNPISGQPAVIVLDEFQHFRTKTETGTEKEHKSFIWDLLDHGRIELFSVPDDFGSMNNLVKDLEEALDEGVVVKNNRVVTGGRIVTGMVNYRKYFQEMNHTTRYYDKFNGLFFPETFAGAMAVLCDGREGTADELYGRLGSMDGHQIIATLKKMLKTTPFTQVVDCSKNLIFVIGNLDELHRVHDDVDPDIDPDHFKENTTCTTLSEVKQALSARFRTEQIARLGNVHIVYPALGREAYEHIIDRELGKIQERTRKVAGVTLDFDPSVRAFLFRDGVVPSQGTRPLFSTIHAHVGANVARILAEQEVRGLTSTRALVRSQGNLLFADFIQEGGSVVHRLNLPVELHIEGDRVSPKDRLTALVALHEAGHAAVAMGYFGIEPEVVTAASAEHRGGGFTRLKRERRGDNLIGVRGHIAISFAGPLAEILFFGRERMTQGSNSDLEVATKAATRAIRRDGFGSTLARYSYPTSEGAEATLADPDGAVAREAAQLMEDAKQIAQEIIAGEKPFILALAREVFEQGSVKAPRIRELAQAFGSPRIKGAPLFPDFDYKAELLRLTEAYAPAMQVNPNPVTEMVAAYQAEVDGKDRGPDPEGLDSAIPQ